MKPQSVWTLYERSGTNDKYTDWLKARRREFWTAIDVPWPESPESVQAMPNTTERERWAWLVAEYDERFVAWLNRTRE